MLSVFATTDWGPIRQALRTFCARLDGETGSTQLYGGEEKGKCASLAG